MTKRVEIYVADDDVAMCKMLSSFLRERGFAVTEDYNGEELVARLKEKLPLAQIPDLVVCDYQMTGTNGFGVLLWIKEWLPKLPVILITAFGDAETHSRARFLGAADVVDKPFDLNWFFGRVNKVLGASARMPAVSDA